MLFCDTLPVQIVSFTGYAQKSSVFLQWATATEEHNAGFLIFRSDSSAAGWSDSVQAGEFVMGNGTSNIPHYYTLEDVNVSPGYYRYTLVDYTNEGTASVYPEKVYVHVEASTPSTVIDEFFATVEKRTVTVTWETTAEYNTQSFILERKDSLHTTWESVAVISGAGTTNDVNIYVHKDSLLANGMYWYRLKYLETDSTEHLYDSILTVSISILSVADVTILPRQFELFQNYPNPFNPTTTIKYQITASSFVTLRIFDMLGKERATVVKSFQNAGNYSVQFDGSRLSSGTYFYCLQVGNFSVTKKFVLLK